MVVGLRAVRLRVVFFMFWQSLTGNRRKRVSTYRLCLLLKPLLKGHKAPLLEICLYRSLGSKVHITSAGNIHSILTPRFNWEQGGRTAKRRWVTTIWQPVKKPVAYLLQKTVRSFLPMHRIHYPENTFKLSSPTKKLEKKSGLLTPRKVRMQLAKTWRHKQANRWSLNCRCLL